MNTKSLNKKNRSGFTLIELLVVISIIGLLSSFAVVSLNSARMKARDALRKGDMSQLRTAMVLYYDDNFAYPICGGSDWDPEMDDFGAIDGNELGQGCDCYTWMTGELAAGDRPVMPEPPVDPMNPENLNCAANPQHYRYISSPNGQAYAAIYHLEEGGWQAARGY